jgi:tetratricopeptide (TPR) repeat protein
MSDLPDLKSLWNFDDPAGTEAKFRDLLSAAKSDPAYHVELLTQIARTHGLRRQFDQAHALLDEAESLLRPDMHRPRVRCLLERGRAHRSAGNREKSVPFFESALAVATENHLDFFAADAAHMIAIAHPDPAEQIRWNMKTIELAEASGNESVKSWIGTSYNNIGWTYHEQREYAKSLQWLEKARDYYDSPQNKNEKFKFIAHWAVAKLLRLNNRPDEALPIQKKLEADMEAKETIDGFVYEELGELHLTRDPDIAKAYFRKAYDQLHKVDWLTHSEPARVQRIANLAGISPPPA